MKTIKHVGHFKILQLMVCGIACWLVGTSVEAGELPHRTTKQVAPSVYDSVSDKVQVQSKLKIDPSTGKATMDDSPMFEGTTHTFVGEIYEFVRAVSDGLPAIISATHPEYDLNSKTNPLLSTVGIVHLGEKGFVKGTNAKSGWINMCALGKYTNAATGESERIIFDGITFWVNKGGENWLDFTVKNALVGENFSKEVKFTTGIEEVSPGVNRPFIKVMDRYKLYPNIVSLTEITFDSVELSTAVQ